MALFNSSSSQSKGIVNTILVLVLAFSSAAIFLFFLLSFLSSYPCPSSPATRTTTTSAVSLGGGGGGGGASGRFHERVAVTLEDVAWVRDQIWFNGLHMQDNILRKRINPCTRAQQLEDLKH